MSPRHRSSRLRLVPRNGASITKKARPTTFIAITSMTTRPPVVEIIEPEMVAMWRGKTPGEKLNIYFQTWEFARQITEAGIRQQHPEWSDDEVLRETASRLSHGLTERVRRECVT